MSLDIRGCGTALVTPFQQNGSIDEEALRRLVQFQLREGVDFLVPCGTTGETPTLEHGEYLGILRLVLDEAGGRVPVVAGVGGNNTRKICALAREVEPLGVQAILSVAPYYNKPTQEGLFQHFRAVAESTGLPVILYNVPGRTSSNIEPATVERLAAISNIIGIKEASGNLAQQMELIRTVPPDFRVLSGDDAVTFPLMALGGVGVISVVSNLIPRLMTELVRLALDGNFERARSVHYRLLPLIQACFFETNPIPIKAALAMMGMIQEIYRLPLCPMKPENRAKLEKVMAAQGLMEPQKV
jgi:4-hydroxy-tetrahydrodipicolinate synthase